MMKTKRRLLIAGIIGGAVWILSSFVGFLGTVASFGYALNTLDASEISDPSTLGGAVGEIIISLVSALIIALPGVILFIGCIVGLVLSNRKPKPVSPDGNDIITPQS